VVESGIVAVPLVRLTLVFPASFRSRHRRMYGEVLVTQDSNWSVIIFLKRLKEEEGKRKELGG
jgi:hypothetical protein